MEFFRPLKLCLVTPLVAGFCAALSAQSSPKPSSAPPSSSVSHAQKSAAGESGIDAGGIVNGVYRNKTLGLSYKIPAGWVLRTEEMNTRGEGDDPSSGNLTENPHFSQKQGEMGHPGPDSRGDCPAMCSKVLLAAFSRPPEARGEDVNSSILIAAESVAAYPGLKDPAQYFGPLTEVAKARGFAQNEEPYEIALGSKVVVRGDFHKDVWTRVMRQSTLAFLSHGYAISITVIGGTQDEVDELIDAVTFAGK